LDNKVFELNWIELICFHEKSFMKFHEMSLIFFMIFFHEIFHEVLWSFMKFHEISWLHGMVVARAVFNVTNRPTYNNISYCIRKTRVINRRFPGKKINGVSHSVGFILQSFFSFISDIFSARFIFHHSIPSLWTHSYLTNEDFYFQIVLWEDTRQPSLCMFPINFLEQ
jgi:hypothetical protein